MGVMAGSADTASNLRSALVFALDSATSPLSADFASSSLREQAVFLAKTLLPHVNAWGPHDQTSGIGAFISKAAKSLDDLAMQVPAMDLSPPLYNLLMTWNRDFLWATHLDTFAAAWEALMDLYFTDSDWPVRYPKDENLYYPCCKGGGVETGIFPILLPVSCPALLSEVCGRLDKADIVHRRSRMWTSGPILTSTIIAHLKPLEDVDVKPIREKLTYIAGAAAVTVLCRIVRSDSSCKAVLDAAKVPAGETLVDRRLAAWEATQGWWDCLLQPLDSAAISAPEGATCEPAVISVPTKRRTGADGDYVATHSRGKLRLPKPRWSRVFATIMCCAGYGLDNKELNTGGARVAKQLHAEIVAHVKDKFLEITNSVAWQADARTAVLCLFVHYAINLNFRQYSRLISTKLRGQAPLRMQLSTIAEARASEPASDVLSRLARAQGGRSTDRHSADDAVSAVSDLEGIDWAGAMLPDWPFDVMSAAAGEDAVDAMQDNALEIGLSVSSRLHRSDDETSTSEDSSSTPSMAEDEGDDLYIAMNSPGDLPYDPPQETLHPVTGALRSIADAFRRFL